MTACEQRSEFTSGNIYQTIPLDAAGILAELVESDLVEAA